ncbi:MAG: bifunctional ornithine acetyltransferase/N-acetylglutamate synthase, partial [Candidatus Omnitrophica bacterium]|nr:bifunctional ornithine acetyltransferase/N-acetylglutamate synthase [Candidatus Omnitrophota bacterium]
RFFEINVTGAKTRKQAKEAAMKIANSNLVKTADYTDNPNWGRVAAAVGACGFAGVSEKTMKITFSVKRNHITINADLGIGPEVATVFSCDLTHGYININGKYN